MKIVMCKGIWPEDDYADFEVFCVKEGEGDEEAIDRAKKDYGDDADFYIKGEFKNEYI